MRKSPRGFQLCPVCCEYELQRSSRGGSGDPYMMICGEHVKTLFPIPPTLLEMDLLRWGHNGDKYRVDMRRPR